MQERLNSDESLKVFQACDHLAAIIKNMLTSVPTHLLIQELKSRPEIMGIDVFYSNQLLEMANETNQ